MMSGKSDRKDLSHPDEFYSTLIKEEYAILFKKIATLHSDDKVSFEDYMDLLNTAIKLYDMTNDLMDLVK